STIGGQQHPANLSMQTTLAPVSAPAQQLARLKRGCHWFISVWAAFCETLQALRERREIPEAAKRLLNPVKRPKRTIRFNAHPPSPLNQTTFGGSICAKGSVLPKAGGPQEMTKLMSAICLLAFMAAIALPILVVSSDNAAAGVRKSGNPNTTNCTYQGGKQ